MLKDFLLLGNLQSYKICSDNLHATDLGCGSHTTALASTVSPQTSCLSRLDATFDMAPLTPALGPGRLSSSHPTGCWWVNQHLLPGSLNEWLCSGLRAVRISASAQGGCWEWIKAPHLPSRRLVHSLCFTFYLIQYLSNHQWVLCTLKFKRHCLSPSVVKWPTKLLSRNMQ